MKVSTSILLPLASALFCVNAAAQLRMPQSAPAPAAPAASAARSAAPAAAPAADHSKEEAAGQLAASGWLVLLDRRDWGRAWETSSRIFRASVPLAKWMDGIPKVREGMGTFVERQPAQAMYKPGLEGQPDGDYVTVVFRSKFGDRELEEVVTTVREPDGKWLVTGYSTR